MLRRNHRGVASQEPPLFKLLVPFLAIVSGLADAGIASAAATVPSRGSPCGGPSGLPVVVTAGLPHAAARRPALAADGDRVWIAWEAPLDPPVFFGAIRARSYAPSYYGADWGPGDLVTPSPVFRDASNEGPVLVSDDGGPWLFGKTRDPIGRPGLALADLDVAMSRWNGTWSVPVLASPVTPWREYEYAPAAARLGTRIVLAYADGTNGTTALITRTWSGGTWSPEVDVAGPAGQETTREAPSLVVMDDRIVLVWQEESPAGVSLRWSTGDGLAWSEPGTVVQHPVSSRTFPTVSVLGDRVALAYVLRKSPDPSVDESDVFLRWYDGRTWSGATEVTPDSDHGMNTYPALAGFRGGLEVAWSTTDPSTADGPDADVVLRRWQNLSLGPVRPVSRVGDPSGTGGVGDLPAATGRDDQVTLLAANDRLWAAWTTFDPAYADPNGTVVLDLLEDSDRDDDGVLDLLDADPGDPRVQDDPECDGVTGDGGHTPAPPMTGGPGVLVLVATAVGAALVAGLIVGIRRGRRGPPPGIRRTGAISPRRTRRR